MTTTEDNKTNKTNTGNVLITLFVGLVLIAVALLVGRCTKTCPDPETIETHDTTYIHHTDTVKVDTIIYKDRTILDTFIIRDTFLIREQLSYEDSLSQIWVSGINPSIDSIKHFIPRDTVVITNDITHVIQRKHGWTVTVGVYGGYGISIDGQKRLIGSPEIGIGVAIGYGFDIGRKK